MFKGAFKFSIPKEVSEVNILILFSLANYGGQIPLECEMLWQLWCQSPESGYAQCTLPSSHTENRGGQKRTKDIFKMFKS